MMDLPSIALGLAAGICLTLLFTYLYYKAGFISKKIFEELSAKHIELNTQFRLSEEKYVAQKAENEKISSEIMAHDARIGQMIATNASQETAIANYAGKIAELKLQIEELTKGNHAHQNTTNQLNESLANVRASFDALKHNFLRETEINKNLQNQNIDLTEKVNQLSAERSTLLANNHSLAEKLLTQKDEMNELQAKARLEFEKIANQILEEKSSKFTLANQVNMEALLKPLGENIETFKKKVEDTYDKESRERFTLEKSVKELIEQTNKVSSEANNLATALKGQSKKQGDWGEMILESILEKSGLTKGREYTMQETIKDEHGNNLRPDVIVTLPENRRIIIDSKVSLVAYDRYTAADSNEAQLAALKFHITSIYAHVDQLSQKRYDQMEGSLDFVMMFIPIEPAYLTAIQADQELWAYAYNKRILLISPTNLIAALKLVTDLWKRELQNRNALEIARQGEKLYEKFIGFVDTMEDVGRHINKSQDAYQKAVGQLKDGRGNLVQQALRLKKLGVKSDKEIAAAMLPLAEEDDE